MAKLNLKDQILERISFGDLKKFYSQYFDKFGKTNSNGDVKVVCPFHEDTDPSLSINLFTGQFFCFGCGAKGDIFSFLEKKEGFNFKKTLSYFADFLGIDENTPKTTKKTKKKMGEIDIVHNYVDLNGKVVYQTVRYKNPKDFKQRRPNPNKPDKFIWSLKGVNLIPYNLSEVVKASTVYIVEGEKDVDRLSQIGLVASCNPLGAGKWPDNLSSYFKDKEIIILPDNDTPGKNHAELVAGKLANVAKSIKIINLPNLKDSEDVSDWLSHGNTKADLEEIVKLNGNQFESHIDYLNKKHAVIMIGGKFFILNEEWDPILNRPDISFSSVNDFKNRYQNRLIPNPNAGVRGHPQKISIATDWLKSPDRIEYERLVFSPNNNIGNCYNLWRGFAFEPAKGKWNLLQDHILENIAVGDQYIYDWLVTWMARIIQDPGGDKPGTSVVLRGEQGVGKGTFLSSFGKLFGHHFLHINNQRHLTSNFNSHLKDVLYLFVDEGFWAGDKIGEGIIKGIVTEDTILIEPKGKDALAVRNHINLVMASNNEWIVPTGFGERRFFVLDVSQNHKQDIPYFQAIRKQMENGGYEAMLYDLLEYDITKINIKQFPHTNAGFDQLSASMTPVQKFWYEILREGKLLPDATEWECLAPCKKFYNQYIAFCNDIGVRRRHPSNQFGKEIRILCPQVNRVRLSNNNSGSYDYSARSWFYEFPALRKCRNLFLKKVGLSDFDWDSDSLISI